ncbi:M23 family metallopeptidase [Caulobacter hibisci]|uniref:M23 family metallopeptidase n=1 Tax=Caulobacter hibisci TaxID=2035993 RepID=A0ABS0SWS7_9CAUL|nr:M23 family metallopeptidase [Caulobacter hibisci]MBI1683979.1 M23 family metallopeptidase [Caulobacter hibisci]
MHFSAMKTLPPQARVALGLAVLFAPMAGLAMESPHVDMSARPAVQKLLDRIEADEPKPVRMETVWKGADVDGDGAADFANPTGAAPREHDDFGDGAFGARRDGGSRRHEGVDYTAVAGQAAKAPISGYVTKIGYAYADSTDLRFVEITNPALGYVARAFYVDPSVEVGQTIHLGQTIGHVASLQKHYPGITNHVHLEVMKPGGRRINAAALIQPKLVAAA